MRGLSGREDRSSVPALPLLSTPCVGVCTRTRTVRTRPALLTRGIRMRRDNQSQYCKSCALKRKALIFSNTDVGPEVIKSSHEATSAEGAPASYHPCPQEVLQRRARPRELRRTALQTIWKSPSVPGARFHPPVLPCYQQRLNPSKQTDARPEARRHGRGLGEAGVRLSSRPSAPPPPPPQGRPSSQEATRRPCGSDNPR